VLNDANVTGATLTRADLHQANLTDIKLHRADLHGACLWGAHLVSHGGRQPFDKDTVLPDESRWDGKQDSWRRFTDPNHPQFWRDTDSRSPASRDRTHH
jgi:hypothetical protein